jgi:hypothetical protein
MLAIVVMGKSRARGQHEALGFGTWLGVNNVVVVTEPGENLGVLDVSDGKHPRLKHIMAVSGSVALSSTDYDEVEQLVNLKHPDN